MVSPSVGIDLPEGPAIPFIDIFFVRVSIAVERHHDYANCYKGKQLIGPDL